MQKIISKFVGEYEFLSNFYDLGGTSVEHWYQMWKTQDPGWQKRILCSKTPGEAKALGSHCPRRDDWGEIKIPVMLAQLRAKFAAYPQLAKQLLDTGHSVLIEGNDWGDTFWGVDENTCKGNNVVGILLMLVRRELRDKYGDMERVAP